MKNVTRKFQPPLKLDRSWNVLAKFGIMILALLVTIPAQAGSHRQIAGRVEGVSSFTFLNYQVASLYPLLATIRVYSERNSIVAEAVSDEYGNFVISGLKPGTYEIIVASNTTWAPFWGNGAGSYTIANQRVTLHKPQDVLLEFTLFFIPN